MHTPVCGSFHWRKWAINRIERLKCPDPVKCNMAKQYSATGHTLMSIRLMCGGYGIVVKRWSIIRYREKSQEAEKRLQKVSILIIATAIITITGHNVREKNIPFPLFRQDGTC